VNNQFFFRKRIKRPEIRKNCYTSIDILFHTLNIMKSIIEDLFGLKFMNCLKKASKLSKINWKHTLFCKILCIHIKISNKMISTNKYYLIPSNITFWTPSDLTMVQDILMILCFCPHFVQISALLRYLQANLLKTLYNIYFWMIPLSSKYFDLEIIFGFKICDLVFLNLFLPIFGSLLAAFASQFDLTMV